MSKLHIALLQILPGETREENLETGINACRKAKEMGGGYRPVSGNVQLRLPDSTQQR